MPCFDMTQEEKHSTTPSKGSIHGESAHGTLEHATNIRAGVSFVDLSLRAA